MGGLKTVCQSGTNEQEKAIGEYPKALSCNAPLPSGMHSDVGERGLVTPFYPIV